MVTGFDASLTDVGQDEMEMLMHSIRKADIAGLGHVVVPKNLLRNLVELGMNSAPIDEFEGLKAELKEAEGEIESNQRTINDLDDQLALYDSQPLAIVHDY